MPSQQPTALSQTTKQKKSFLSQVASSVILSQWQEKRLLILVTIFKPCPFVRLLIINICVCDGLYMLGPGSGTLKEYGPIGVGVALLE